MAKRSKEKQVSADWATTYRPMFERVLFALALLGVLTTVHLYIQQGRGFDRGCLGFSSPETVDVTFNCEAVTSSAQGKIFGVSNAIAGLMYYLAVALLTAGVAFMAGSRSWVKKARLGLVTIGFLYSLYLSYIQYFQLQELCFLCLTSAVIAVVLFATQMVEWRRPIGQRSESTPAVALYGGMVALLVVLIAADFVYFNNLEHAAPPAPATAEAALASEGECLLDTQKPFVDDYLSLVDDDDPIEGNPNASVTVIEFFDPNCPHCRAMHPILEDVAAEYSDRVRFVFKPIALPGWDHSVPQVAAMIAAEQQGKFFEMMDRQFELQQPRTGLSMDQLVSIANELGMDGEAMAQRINNGLYMGPVRKRQMQAMQTGMSGVPAIIINGQFIQSKSRTCMAEFLDQALADASESSS